MEDNTIGKPNSRRTFLRRAGITSGLLATGIIPVQGAASACGYNDDKNYDELYPFWEDIGSDQVKESECDSGFNSGTRMDMASVGTYWESHQWSWGGWTHNWSNHAHSEHFRHTDDGECDWYRDSGLYWHSWRANEHVDGNSIEINTGSDWVGAYPGTDNEEEDHGDKAYTGLLDVVEYWPASSTIAKASKITLALLRSVNDVSDESFWDAELEWDYFNEAWKTCASHYNRYNTNGPEENDETHVVSQDRFRNDYFDIWVSHDMHVTDPYEDSTTSTKNTKHSQSEVEEGDIVHLGDGKKGRIISVNKNRGSKPGGEKEEVDPKRFKRMYPALAENYGVPEYTQEWSVSSVTTTVTAKHI